MTKVVYRNMRNCIDCKKSHNMLYVQEYVNGLYGYTCQECVDKEKEQQ
jgi:hypothetical protein